MTIDELLNAKEGENYEFKSAVNKYDFGTLVKYGSALANKGGGKIILGITDKRPRRVVGSQAFDQPERTRRGMMDALKIKVDFDIYNEGTPQRVLVFNISGRPIGIPVQANGVAWWRDGDSLVPMPEDVRRRIYEESGRDFTAEACPGATLDDLDPAAIETFRRVWMAKRGNAQVANVSHRQLLADCEALTRSGEVTYAALILFGKREALGEFLANAELVFEYRQNEASGPAGQREEFRMGFFSCFDRLWELINIRNLKLPYQEGFFVYDVFAYNERSVREAVLNAVCHRNYQLPGSVFIRQYPDKIVFESPGGFIGDITTDNILDRQAARNRRLAEILGRCGLVERSGQGMNLIFEECVKDAKALPDFDGTDAHRVKMTLGAAIVDDSIIRLLKAIGESTLSSFATEDLLAVRGVLMGTRLSPGIKKRFPRLVKLGVLERTGKNKVLVSRKYYKSIGVSGSFTRLKGLDSDTNKELLLSHMRNMGNTGAKRSELAQVLPSLGERQIQWLLKSLQFEGKACVSGIGRGAKWYVTNEKGQVKGQERTSELTSIDK